MCAFTSSMNVVLPPALLYSLSILYMLLCHWLARDRWRESMMKGDFSLLPFFHFSNPNSLSPIKVPFTLASSISLSSSSRLLRRLKFGENSPIGSSISSAVSSSYPYLDPPSISIDIFTPLPRLPTILIESRWASFFLALVPLPKAFSAPLAPPFSVSSTAVSWSPSVV